MDFDLYSQTVKDLNILGTIHENDRLYTSQRGHIDVGTPNKFSFLYRGWYKEDRASNIEIVKRITQTAFLISNEFHRSLESSSNHSDIEHVQQQQKLNTLISALTVARTGIFNLTETYRDDTNTCIDIRCIVKSIDDYLERQKIRIVATPQNPTENPSL